MASKYEGTLYKVLPDEKSVATFLKSGEVSQLIGLFLKKNDSFVVFYFKDEPEKEIKKQVLGKTPRKE